MVMLLSCAKGKSQHQCLACSMHVRLNEAPKEVTASMFTDHIATPDCLSKCTCQYHSRLEPASAERIHAWLDVYMFHSIGLLALYIAACCTCCKLVHHSMTVNLPACGLQLHYQSRRPSMQVLCMPSVICMPRPPALQDTNMRQAIPQYMYNSTISITVLLQIQVSWLTFCVCV